MKRYGSIIKVVQEKLDEYKQLHTAVWPAVLKQIRRSNIRNYGIFYKDRMLFSYFEYISIDYE